MLALFPPCAPPRQLKPPTSPKSPIISTKTSKPLTNTRNWLFYTGTYGVSAPLLSKIFDICNATLYDFNPPGGVVWSIAFEPLPTLVTEHGSLKGGNSLGTSPKDGNAVSKSPRTSSITPNFPSTLYPLPPTHYPLNPQLKPPTVLLLAALWPTPASNPPISQTAQALLSAINHQARAMNLLHKFQYLNYADPSQDPIGSYGEESVERLRRASAKYDRRRVFQTRVPGGFKLRR